MDHSKLQPGTLQTVPKNQKNPFGFAVWLPENWNITDTFPLIFLFHGLGEYGDGSQVDLQKLTRSGSPADQVKQLRVNAIVIFPQIHGTFEGDTYVKLYEWMKQNFKFYPKVGRTGYSMGGKPVLKDLELFEVITACAAPICAAYDYKTEIHEKVPPVWAFTNFDTKFTSGHVHVLTTLNNMDKLAIPPVKAKDVYGYPTMQAEIRTLYYYNGQWNNQSGIEFQAHGFFNCTVYPKTSHNAWTDTYGMPEFWKWMIDMIMAAAGQIPEVPKRPLEDETTQDLLLVEKIISSSTGENPRELWGEIMKELYARGEDKTLKMLEKIKQS